MSLFNDGSGVQGWEVMVTTLAAALTPYLAYKFRERRAKKPKSPQEALYQYYENYIDRLEKQIAKKDLLIDTLEKQNHEQRDAYEKIIIDLQDRLQSQRKELDDRQVMIDQLKVDIQGMQERGQEVHKRISKLKQQASVPTTEFDA